MTWDGGNIISKYMQSEQICPRSLVTEYRAILDHNERILQGSGVASNALMLQ